MTPYKNLFAYFLLVTTILTLIFYLSVPIAAGCIITGLAIFRKSILSQPLITLTFIACSLFIPLFIQLRYHQLEKRQASFYTSYHNKNLFIKGVITNLEETDNKQFPFKTSLKSTTINHLSSNHSILIYSAQKPRVHIDDIVLSEGIVLKEPKNSDYKAYLIKEGVTGTAFIASPKITVLSRPNHSLYRFIHDQKTMITTRLKKNMNKTCFAFFSSLFLGNKAEGVSIEIKRNFAEWGVSHYLARSGLHLVIFIMLWTLLLRLIPLPWWNKDLLLLLICSLYLILSWNSLSFFRAFATIWLYKSFCLSSKQVMPLHILSCVTLGVLLYNPHYASFLDFQLSFGITAALLWFAHLKRQRLLYIYN